MPTHHIKFGELKLRMLLNIIYLPIFMALACIDLSIDYTLSHLTPISCRCPENSVFIIITVITCNAGHFFCKGHRNLTFCDPFQSKHVWKVVGGWIIEFGPFRAIPIDIPNMSDILHTYIQVLLAESQEIIISVTKGCWATLACTCFYKNSNSILPATTHIC